MILLKDCILVWKKRIIIRYREIDAKSWSLSLNSNNRRWFEFSLFIQQIYIRLLGKSSAILAIYYLLLIKVKYTTTSLLQLLASVKNLLEKISTLWLLALNSSKAVLIIVMKQISKLNCKENLSLEVIHYLLLYFTLIFHYIVFSTLPSTWLSFAINMKRNVLLLCCHIF